MYDYDRTAAIQWSETPTDYQISGTYNELKSHLKKIKNQGWQWDPRTKVWSISKSKITPRQLTNIKKVLGLGEKSIDPAKSVQILKSLEGVKPLHTNPKTWVIPDVGIDLQSTGASKTQKGWLFDTTTEDTSILAKLAPKLKQRLEVFAREQEKAMKSLQALKGLEGVTLSEDYVTLSTPATIHIKDRLRGLGFRYSNRSWQIPIQNLDSDEASELAQIFQEALKTEEAERQRVIEQREERGKLPPSEKQIAFLEKLIRKYRSGWYDATDGIGGFTPPTSEQIQRMDRREVGGLIDLLLDNEY